MMRHVFIANGGAESMLTELEKAYLAGFVDADGCIAITKSTSWGEYM